MRALAPARLLLAASGAATALAADGRQTASAALVIVIAFLVTGEARLLLRLALTLLPILLFSAALWLFIDGIGDGAVLAATRLLSSGSPFLSLTRALVGSCAVVLALGTVPDGEGMTMLRSVGLPLGAATIIASGSSAAGGIGEGFSRSVTAMRAHGLVGPGRLAVLLHLGPILALTWTSSLSEIVSRAEIKWSGNSFLAKLDPARPKADRAVVWSTFVTLSGSASLFAIILGAAG